MSLLKEINNEFAYILLFVLSFCETGNFVKMHTHDRKCSDAILTSHKAMWNSGNITSALPSL